MNSESTVLVERLKESLDPFWLLGWRTENGGRKPPPTAEDFSKHLPVTTFLEHHKRPSSWFNEYDWGRIAYFIEELRQGRTLPAIEIDCLCDAGNIYPEAVMLDGCHRFAAHIAAGSQTIQVAFGGRIDYLEWLEGKRAEKPDEY